jgi:predicted DNA binding CopG/RHH family protein
MKEEYELKDLRIKRRGLLPGIEVQSKRSPKVRITIALDQDLIEHFKAEAAKPGGLPYQTQINQALRQALALESSSLLDPSALKEALLGDSDFLEALAEKVRAKPAA